MNDNSPYKPIIYQSRLGYNYSFIFAHEKKCFNENTVAEKKAWMSSYFYYVVAYAIAYVIFIFSARKFMEKREKFELRRFLIAWNFLLSLFSALGAIRVWPEFIYVIREKGLEYSFCNHDWAYGVQACWCSLFIYSKVAELMDTVFIVARKQKLIFLHWYHHFTVLLYVWYSSKEIDSAASGIWFMVMNYTVHAFMYAYYGISALRFRIPKWVNIAITSMQIIQMVIGIYINLTAYLIKKRNGNCSISDNNLRFSFLMYLSYFILFFNFFYKVYIAPKLSEKFSIKENDYSKGKIKANGFTKFKKSF
jgi:elongation of very long chain fatty acids protein 6